MAQFAELVYSRATQIHEFSGDVLGELNPVGKLREQR